MTEQATANRIWYRDFNMMALEKILKIIIIFGIRILTASQVENVGEDVSAAVRVQSMRVYLHNGTFRTFDELQQLKNSLVFDENHNSKDRYYELKSKNKTFVFHVFPDFELISSRFHIEHVFNDSMSLKFQRKNLRNCHFSGKIVDDENSAVVLDTCYNLRGAFKTSHGSFVIEPVSQLVNNNKEITEQTIKRMPQNGYSSYNPGSCAVKVPACHLESIATDPNQFCAYLSLEKSLKSSGVWANGSSLGVVCSAAVMGSLCCVAPTPPQLQIREEKYVQASNGPGQCALFKKTIF